MFKIEKQDRYSDIATVGNVYFPLFPPVLWIRIRIDVALQDPYPDLYTGNAIRIQEQGIYIEQNTNKPNFQPFKKTSVPTF
jgi:hypothetical protein